MHIRELLFSNIQDNAEISFFAKLNQKIKVKSLDFQKNKISFQKIMNNLKKKFKIKNGDKESLEIYIYNIVDSIFLKIVMDQFSKPNYEICNQIGKPNF